MHCIYQLQKAGSYPPLTSWLLKLLKTMLAILFCSCPCYSGLSNCWSFSDNAWSLLVQLLALAACQKTGFDLPECILGVWGGLTCITFLGLKSRLSWTRWLQTVLTVLKSWNQQPRRWQDSALPGDSAGKSVACFFWFQMALGIPGLDFSPFTCHYSLVCKDLDPCHWI